MALSSGDTAWLVMRSRSRICAGSSDLTPEQSAEKKVGILLLCKNTDTFTCHVYNLNILCFKVQMTYIDNRTVKTWPFPETNQLFFVHKPKQTVATTEPEET